MKTNRMYEPDELRCAYLIHPGEMLLDELKARGMSQRKFADLVGGSYSVVNEIVNGKRGISTEMALKIEAALDTPASVWCNLQTAYNMQKARSDKSLSALLAKIRTSAAVL